jgi:hypothetical protein
VLCGCSASGNVPGVSFGPEQSSGWPAPEQPSDETESPVEPGGSETRTEEARTQEDSSSGDASTSREPPASQPKCGNGVLEASGRESCDTADLGGKTCQDFGFSRGELHCSTSCRLDTQECSTCGDGRREGSEACDGQDLAQKTCNTVGAFGGGTLRCRTDCTFDTSACVASQCGNGVREGNEVCDGLALGPLTCSTQTAGARPNGTLICAASCASVDSSGCTAEPASTELCGNGIRDPGELCDGAALPAGATCATQRTGTTGTLTCAVGCQSYDLTGCVDPNACLPDDSPCDAEDTCCPGQGGFGSCMMGKCRAV